MKVGRRLAIKLLNASKFVLARSEPRGAVTNPSIAGMLTNLVGARRDATEQFEQYDYARVLQHTETFFWDFCDDYLELGKRGGTGIAARQERLPRTAAMLLRSRC